MPSTQRVDGRGSAADGRTNTITRDPRAPVDVAFTSAHRTHKHWSVSQFYMGGNQKSAGSGWRQLSDTIVTLTPGPHARAYVEMLGGIEKRVTPGYDRWFGWATGWTFMPHDKWSISPRAEWYSDPTGATTGLAQHMAEDSRSPGSTGHPNSSSRGWSTGTTGPTDPGSAAGHP